MDKSDIHNSWENREKKVMQYLPRCHYPILSLKILFYWEIVLVGLICLSILFSWYFSTLDQHSESLTISQSIRRYVSTNRDFSLNWFRIFAVTLTWAVRNNFHFGVAKSSSRTSSELWHTHRKTFSSLEALFFEKTCEKTF